MLVHIRDARGGDDKECRGDTFRHKHAVSAPQGGDKPGRRDILPPHDFRTRTPGMAEWQHAEHVRSATDFRATAALLPLLMDPRGNRAGLRRSRCSKVETHTQAEKPRLPPTAQDTPLGGEGRQCMACRTGDNRRAAPRQALHSSRQDYSP